MSRGGRRHISNALRRVLSSFYCLNENCCGRVGNVLDMVPLYSCMLWSAAIIYSMELSYNYISLMHSCHIYRSHMVWQDSLD